MVDGWILMDDHVGSVVQLLYHWDWVNIVLPDTSVIRHTIKSGLIWLLLFFLNEVLYERFLCLLKICMQEA